MLLQRQVHVCRVSVVGEWPLSTAVKMRAMTEQAALRKLDARTMMLAGSWLGVSAITLPRCHGKNWILRTAAMNRVKTRMLFNTIVAADVPTKSLSSLVSKCSGQIGRSHSLLFCSLLKT